MHSRHIPLLVAIVRAIYSYYQAKYARLQWNYVRRYATIQLAIYIHTYNYNYIATYEPIYIYIYIYIYIRILVYA